MSALREARDQNSSHSAPSSANSYSRTSYKDSYISTRETSSAGSRNVFGSLSYRQPKSSGSSYTNSRLTGIGARTSSVHSEISRINRENERKKERDREKEKEKEKEAENERLQNEKKSKEKEKKSSRKEKKGKEKSKDDTDTSSELEVEGTLKKKKSRSLLDLGKKFGSKFSDWFSDDVSHNYSEKHIRLERRHSVAEISSEKVKKESLPDVKSILKRHDDMCPSYRQTPSLSSNRREGPVSLKKAKNCVFKTEVSVIYYAQTDKTSKCLGRETKQLQEERETSSDVTEGFIQVHCKIHPGKPCMGPYWYRTRPGYKNLYGNDISAVDTEFNYESIFKGLEIDIIEDESGIVRLKIFLPITKGFLRNKTSVKAMSGGKKLIVIAYKCEIDDSGQEYLHQYVEKLHLPHPIDAYCVRATMDKDGNLKIDAPMMLNEYIRRDSIDHSNVRRLEKKY